MINKAQSLDFVDNVGFVLTYYEFDEQSLKFLDDMYHVVQLVHGSYFNTAIVENIAQTTWTYFTGACAMETYRYVRK